MNIYCESGHVSVGGAAEIKVTLTPQFAGQFDVTLNVDMKEGKSLSLRIAGTVEYPCVSVDKVQMTVQHNYYITMTYMHGNRIYFDLVEYTVVLHQQFPSLSQIRYC